MLELKLKPCPFCGRKMVFHKNTYTNKYGKQVTEQYYMHEDYDISKEDSCILDEIDIFATEINVGRKIRIVEKWDRRKDNG